MSRAADGGREAAPGRAGRATRPGRAGSQDGGREGRKHGPHAAAADGEGREEKGVGGEGRGGLGAGLYFTDRCCHQSPNLAEHSNSNNSAGVTSVNRITHHARKSFVGNHSSNDNDFNIILALMILALFISTYMTFIGG